MIQDIELGKDVTQLTASFAEKSLLAELKVSLS